MDSITAHTGSERGGNDWSSRNLRRRGAIEDVRGDFSLMDFERKSAQGLKDMNSQVWELPERYGVYRSTRLGPRADGPLGRRLRYPPSAARICSRREVLGLLETPHHLPADRRRASDIRLCDHGLSVERELLRSRRWSVLLLPGGNRTKGRHASKTSALAQRGETGYCTRCAVATYAAAPALYNRGVYSAEKAMGVTVWQHRGPWAGRSYAAAF